MLDGRSFPFGLNRAPSKGLGKAFLDSGWRYSTVVILSCPALGDKANFGCDRWWPPAEVLSRPSFYVREAGFVNGWAE